MARDRVIDAHRRHRVAGTRSLDKEVSLDSPVDTDHSQTNLAQKIADTELTPAVATWHELEQRFATAVEKLDDQIPSGVLLRHLNTFHGRCGRGSRLTKPAAGMRYMRAT